MIVLDNTENIQGGEFDEFTEWLMKSAPNVKSIITTRKDVGFVSADVRTFRLKPLDPDSSAKLLRTVLLMTLVRNTPKNLLNYVVGYSPSFYLLRRTEQWF